MSHITETRFGRSVIEWFGNKYGIECVSTQQYLREPYWFCDIVVDTGYAELYIELENDADSIRSGVGQVLGYAGGGPNRVPMVVVPRGHVDSDRLMWLRAGSKILIREFDEDEMAWV